MKKILFFAMMVLALGACKKAATTEPAAETTTVETEAPAAEATATPTKPTFSSPEAQAYVDAYEAYFEAYKEALTSKDQTKLSALTQQATDLAKQGTDALTKLTGDEAKQLQDYISAKSQEFMELAKTATAAQ